MKIPPPTVGRGNKRLDVKVLRSYLDKGMTLKAVGEIFGVTRQRIAQVVGPSGATRARRPVKLDAAKKSLDKVARLIRGGKSLIEICEQLKLSASIVGKLVLVRNLRPPEWTKHGTLARYAREGCRCDRCRKASADYQRESKARVKARREGTK